MNLCHRLQKLYAFMRLINRTRSRIRLKCIFPAKLSTWKCFLNVLINVVGTRSVFTEPCVYDHFIAASFPRAPGKSGRNPSAVELSYDEILLKYIDDPARGLRTNRRVKRPGAERQMRAILLQVLWNVSQHNTRLISFGLG